MSKLGRSMGMTAKTIYNYFINKDEIYLRVLTTLKLSLVTRFDPGAKVFGRALVRRNL